jgi:hypothetical protein
MAGKPMKERKRILEEMKDYHFEEKMIDGKKRKKLVKPNKMDEPKNEPMPVDGTAVIDNDFDTTDIDVKEENDI